MVWVQGLYTIPISFKGIVMVMGMSLGNGSEAQYVLSMDLKHKVYLLDVLYDNMYIYFICLKTEPLRYNICWIGQHVFLN